MIMTLTTVVDYILRYDDNKILMMAIMMINYWYLYIFVFIVTMVMTMIMMMNIMIMCFVTMMMVMLMLNWGRLTKT